MEYNSQVPFSLDNDFLQGCDQYEPLEAMLNGFDSAELESLIESRESLIKFAMAQIALARNILAERTFDSGGEA